MPGEAKEKRYEGGGYYHYKAEYTEGVVLRTELSVKHTQTIIILLKCHVGVLPVDITVADIEIGKSH